MGFMTKIDKLEKAAKAQAEAEFLELIEIDSPSWGEQAIAKVLLRKLKELGMETQQDETGNIYGYLPGNASLPPIKSKKHNNKHGKRPRNWLIIPGPGALHLIIMEIIWEYYGRAKSLTFKL